MKNFENLNFRKKERFKLSFFRKRKKFSGNVGIRLFENPFFQKNFHTQKFRIQKCEPCAQGSEQTTQISSFHQPSKFTPNFIKKKLLNGYSKIHELKLVTIEFASPEKIKAWAEKELPNGKIFGEVTNANTFHYRTFKPSKGGLFCERIFGPLKDFECACGKRQRPSALESRKILEHQKTARSFCPNCDVEYTWSIIRRYQLGYIKLNAPVTHLWYFKSNPSYLSILFDMKRRHLESIIYCTETITIENTWKYSQQTSILNRSPKDLYLTWQKFFTLEEQLQKYKQIYQTQHEQEKQKKRSFRNSCTPFLSHFLTFLEQKHEEKNANQKKSTTPQKKICPQINWKNIDQQKVKKKKNSFGISKTIENRQVFEEKTQKSIFENISMQKQQKFGTYLFEEIWKTVLQKSYKNTFLFLNLQEQFSEHFFQNLYRVSNLFFFSSKKTQKFLNFHQLFIFGNTEALKKTILEVKNKQTGRSSFSSDFIPFLSNQTPIEPQNSLKMKKQYWKSFFFLFEFTRFFLSKKNTKIQNFHFLSKKDFLFLVNLLPFLKKIAFFQNLQILKKNDKKIHSLYLQNISKKNKLSKKRKFFTKNLFTEQNLLTLQNRFEKNNVFDEQNFQEKNFSDFLDGEFSKKKKISEFNLPALFHFSLNFGKILAFLKSYYEIYFCFFVQKNFFDFEKNVSLKNNFSKKQYEMFCNQSTFGSMYENVFFDYFSLFFHLRAHFLLRSFSKNVIKNTQSQKKNTKAFDFSNFNIESSDSFKIFNNFEKPSIFYFKNYKIQNAFFFGVKCFPFLLVRSQYENIQNSSVNLFQSNFEIVSNQNSEFFLEAKKSKKQGELFITNKKKVSRLNFNQRKKQIQNERVQKFFDFDSVPEDFKFPLSLEKKYKLVQKKVSNSFLQLTQIQKKSKEPFLYKFIKPKHQKKKKFKNFSVFLSAKSNLKNRTQKKHQTLKKNHFLQNSITTIAYNHSWNNDADWKYFIYYNSLFFYDFEDRPIFLYESLSPIKDTKTNKAFMFSESNSSSAKFGDSFSSFLPWSMDDVPKNFFVGAGILEKLLTEYSSSELRKMTKQHQILLPKINQMLRFFKQNAKTKKDSLKIQKYFQKREQIIRRLKFLRKFSRRNSNPTFMILKNLPVLPPDLRPILKLQNQIAASDLNRFYQRIIYRNDRFKKFAKDSATNQSFEIKYAQRLLQEAVDNLIQNGKGNVKAETNARGQPLKSLSEILKGKQGRFRQYLLGKRVDYSGRSVIVVGPELKLYECGLPKEMALELFLPFLIQYILQNKLAQTVVGAKNLLKSDSNLTLHLLHKVIQNIPILLNRAPTLHRLGFQAFLPKLIEGRAILLHPMVCPSFNADFDGDQMAVHIPLTVEARTEAWKFMLATNNLMNSATGEAIILPSQDMVLGCYYLTLDFVSKFVGVQLSNLLTKQNAFVPDLKQTIIHNKATLLQGKNFQKFVTLNKRFLFFNNFLFVLNAYERKEISLHTPVWVKWNSPVDFANEVAKPVEIRLQKNGSWEEIQPKYTTFYNHKHKQLQKVIRTTPGRILMNFMIQECSIL